MSLDVWLTETVTIKDSVVVSKNITHNLGEMWRQLGVYDALYNSAGKKAKDVLPVMREGLRLMVENPGKYKRFSATNGWGTYEQALPWLIELVAEFEEHPNGVIGISK